MDDKWHLSIVKPTVLLERNVLLSQTKIPGANRVFIAAFITQGTYTMHHLIVHMCCLVKVTGYSSSSWGSRFLNNKTFAADNVVLFVNTYTLYC